MIRRPPRSTLFPTRRSSDLGNAGATETAAALLGPFWRANSPRTENGGSIVRSPTPGPELFVACEVVDVADRKSTRLNSSHLVISYAVFCLKKKKRQWCSIVD